MGDGMTAMKWRGRFAGVTLIELMVALAVGSLLMIGAVTVFLQSRQTFRALDAVSRLQENGRFALDRLEPDIRMAGYFGLTARSSSVQGRAAPTDPPGLGPNPGCGVNWTIDLATEVEGTNNGYAWPCPPQYGAGTASASADTVVVRRVTADPVAASNPNALYVQSARVVASEIFQGTMVPSLPGISQTHQLIVNGYYVSTESTLGGDVPSLRMKTLVPGSSGPEIRDEEVLPGVEDMQIQLGVDTDDFGQPGRGSINRYVNPGAPILDPGNLSFIPFAQVLSVRVWLRIRAERPEVGYVDATPYAYADQDFGTFGDAFRRVVVSKTIYLRNTRRVI
jgi:type IV pilus assembly protein PilW